MWSGTRSTLGVSSGSRVFSCPENSSRGPARHVTALLPEGERMGSRGRRPAVSQVCVPPCGCCPCHFGGGSLPGRAVCSFRLPPGRAATARRLRAGSAHRSSNSGTDAPTAVSTLHAGEGAPRPPPMASKRPSLPILGVSVRLAPEGWWKSTSQKSSNDLPGRAAGPWEPRPGFSANAALPTRGPRS